MMVMTVMMRCYFDEEDDDVTLITCWHVEVAWPFATR